jgi:hypothetical protein
MNNSPELNGVWLKVMYQRIKIMNFMTILLVYIYNAEGNDLQNPEIGLLCWGSIYSSLRR